MTGCDEVLASLADALDGEPLDPTTEHQVAEHLQACAGCARAARELSSIHRLILETRVEDLAASPPAARKKAHRLARPRPAAPGPWKPALLAAAGLFAVALVAAVMASRPRPSSGRDSEARRRAEERLPELQADREARKMAEDAAARARGERERLEKELAAREEEQRRLPEAQREAQDERKRQELKAREAELARTAAEFRERLRAAQEEERRTADAVARRHGPSPDKPEEAPRDRLGTQATTARVERAEGARLGEGEKSVALEANQEIRAGQGIGVGPGGTAVVVYPDGTRLELGSETEVRDLKAEGGKRIHITKGTVRAVVVRQPKDQPMVFSTPHGEAKVLGTTLRIVVDLDRKKGTRLDVEEGKVQLKNLAARTVDVLGGHYAVAALGGDLVARPLPRTAAQAILESRGAVTIKFGPAGQALPQGVLGDAGEEFDPDRGYGWQGAVAPLPAISNLGTPPLSRKPCPRAAGEGLRGSLIFAGWRNCPVTWSMSVPNGRYWVTVCAGDPTDGALNHVSVEGQLLIDTAPTAAGEYVEPRDVPVVVRDGTITMVLGGQRSEKTSPQGCSDTHLQYLVVRREAPRK